MARAINRLDGGKVGREKRPGMYADGGGLYLQITEAAPDEDGKRRVTKSWIFRYTLRGRAREMGLGSTKAFTLAEARERAREQRKLLADGLDPIEVRDQRRQAAQLEAARAITFKEAAESYIEAHKPGWRNAKHARQWGSTLKTYAEPVLGEIVVQALDTALVMKVLQQNVPPKRGKAAGPFWVARPETASRVRGRIESILDWATTSGYRRGENPARWKGHLENLLPKKSKVAKVEHYPALPYAEIGAFMPKLREHEGTSAQALEFTILCARRTNETIGAKPEEFDVDARVWTIPGERMKGGVDHRVPLSDAALAIVTKRLKAGGKYLFPGTKKGRHLSNAAMLELMRGMKRDDGKRWCDEKGRPAVPHGFRSTFRDWAGDLTNFPNHVVEMALAHVIDDKTEAAYRRSDLFQKRRQLMQAWARYCTSPAVSAGAEVRYLERVGA